MAEEQLPSLGKVIPVELETEMRRSYLDYAMSVIVDRALPDVRDGLKPVQRRILYAMHELNLRPDRPHKKSAAIVGEVMGKYHPHGDAPIYDALVRMAQDFSYRYPLVDGHGNFGCFTGDTRIKLADGTERSFEELAALGPDARFYVYSVDPTTQRIVIAEARNARLTRRAAPLVEVVLDNGSTIRCTPDHRFMLWDGTYKEAQHLQSGDSLMAAYFDEAPVRGGRTTYLRVRQPDGTWEFVHHLADEYNVRNGLVRPVKGAYVRHHVNFNRYDNRPHNVVRVTWREHRRIHAEHLRRLWQDEQFRRRQREGAQRYYTSNPDARELRRLRMSAMNRTPEYKQRQAARRSAILKALFQNDPALRARISQRMRTLWQKPEFRRRMSEALRGLTKKPLSPEVREDVRRRLSASSRSMWANEAKRQEIVAAVREAMQRPEVRARVSAGVKACWQKPEYRLRFSSVHFRELARQLWDLCTGIRERHREEVLRQWRDPEFRRIQAEAVRQSNRRRMAQDPLMMRRLTTLATAQLTVRWRDPEYRYRVMRRKIGRYVSLLLNRYGREAFSPELYERERSEPWIPSFPKALTYFGDVGALLEFAEKFNHRVVAVRPLPERADVYDITVDVYHNFLLAAGVFVHNSVDGDPPAAMRYTEARLSAVAMEMLRDIERETVDFVPNYDNTQKQPVVLPARVPNLLINGASGIAVGMATNIPPHNLGEIVDALVLLIDRPDCSDEELLAVVRGPDFPTGAIILGTEGIREAYLSGRGHLRVRARVQMEPMGGGRTRIVVTELPYMVNKAALIEKIADLVRERRIDGISEVRDESDREGMRIAIELRRDAQPQVVLNRLFKHTPLEDTYGVILLALVDGQPQVLTLRQALRHYLDFQVEVVTRRTRFDLARARERLHIVEGLRIALDHIDEVVALIRSARDEQAARQGLMERFGLSERQAEAILQMQLRRLTGLERGKLDEEYRELQRTIQELTAILEDRARLYGLIRKELLEVKERFADARRTEILPEAPQVEEDDLVALEDIVITLTHNGYIKRQPTSTYRSQRRGGRGVAAMSTRDEDFVEHLFIATTHTQVLLFTDRGKMYHVKGREIPEASRSARGTSILNLLPMSPDESVAAAIAVASFDEGRYLFMATRNGVVKKTPLSEFASVRQGIIACHLDPEDRLVGVRLTGGHQEVLLVTRQGQAVRFPEEQVRPMGRAARGVRGIRLEEGDEVVAMDAVRPGVDVLLVTEQGFGKRTPVDQFRLTGRGGKGVRAIQLSERTGPLVGMRVVEDDDELMLISARGVMIRLRAREVTRQGRQARGVTLMRLDEGDVVTAVAQVAATRDGEPEGEEAPE